MDNFEETLTRQNVDYNEKTSPEFNSVRVIGGKAYWELDPEYRSWGIKSWGIALTKVELVLEYEPVGEGDFEEKEVGLNLSEYEVDYDFDTGNGSAFTLQDLDIDVDKKKIRVTFFIGG